MSSPWNPIPHHSSTPSPPDRAHVLTEQRNPRTMNLHTLGVRELVDTIQREDRAIADAMERAAPSLTAFITAIEPGFLRGGRLVYFGAGTSGRLGVLDASEAPPTFQVEPGRIVGLIAGGDASLRTSSEGREDELHGAHDALRSLKLTRDDSVLGIAAGGTTPYVLGGLALARSLATPPVTGLLACTRVEPTHADHTIVLETGPEVITGSTRMKAGTATKLALNTISTTLMIRAGKVHENLMVDLRATNAKLRDRAARIVSTLTGLSRDAAFALLHEAAGSVKSAVAMHCLGVTRIEAERVLAAHSGRLDRALMNGPPTPP
ncbi:MAG: N-acetylmuramic acid 6-phosphate etherase [Phycisphaerales bacterium]|nr:MAG: N-acetylmuramic acid 6-phosphate etherase [Phycisphaerales bacterium]